MKRRVNSSRIGQQLTNEYKSVSAQGSAIECETRVSSGLTLFSASLTSWAVQNRRRCAVPAVSRACVRVERTFVTSSGFYALNAPCLLATFCLLCSGAPPSAASPLLSSSTVRLNSAAASHYLYIVFRSSHSESLLPFTKAHLLLSSHNALQFEGLRGKVHRSVFGLLESMQTYEFCTSETTKKQKTFSFG